MNEPYYIDGVDVSKCQNFRASCRPDYSGGYLYRNVCRVGSFSSCEGKPCGFKCIAYAKAYKKLANILKMQKKRDN